MIHSSPPAQIIHLFSMAQEQEGVRIRRIVESNAVARSENERISTGLQELRTMLTEIERLIATFSTRMTAMENETTI
jgi:DNA-binding GntR family transcriptional regulator